MRPYAERREARIERLRARAEGKASAAQAAFGTARRIGGAIPFGQPILVGHHSERRARRDAERIDRSMRRGVEAHREAERLERAVVVAERNDAVSSDDPNAVERLREKLAAVEVERDRWKAITRAAKRGAEALRALDLTRQEWTSVQHSVCGTGYMVTNASANARRIQKRIAELTARAERPAPSAETIGDVVIDEQENRVRLRYQSKPDQATRERLKARGFRFCPSDGVWQRMASNGAWHAAREIAAVHTDRANVSSLEGK